MRSSSQLRSFGVICCRILSRSGATKRLSFAHSGLKAESWEVLEAALREVLSEDAERIEVTEYGSKYVVKGSLVGPTGGSAEIATVWIILSGETVPRFITAYPED